MTSTPPESPPAPRKLTPMLKQYLAVKNRHADKILLFRMGDFYEIFFADAEIAARVLKITLTSRNKKSDDAVPMCGFPHHAAENYIAALVRAGHKVVVCDQVEDPKQAKGLVRREVTRIVTPGVNPEGDESEADRDNFLGAVTVAGQGKKARFGLALLDAGTGKFRVTETPDREILLDEIGRSQPREILLPAVGGKSPESSAALQENFPAIHFTLRGDPELFSPTAGYERLCRQFGTLNLDGFGGQHLNPGLGAAGAALAYVQETRPGTSLEHIKSLVVFRQSQFMQLDRSVVINLELLCTIRDQDRQGSLLGVLDRCQTSMGSRQLKEWLLFPLLDRNEIEKRLDAVEILSQEKRCRKKLRENLKQLFDLERLAGRLAAGQAGARDLLSLKESLRLVPVIRKIIESLPLQPRLINQALAGLHDLSSLAGEIERILRPEPPLSITEGGLVNDGIDPELDELRMISRNGRQWLREYEAAEKEKTGINGLKVRFNRVFGYYIEVTRRNLDQIPESYIRRQTLTNADRFITPELKEYEEKILGAEEKINALEYRIFLELRQQAAAEIPRLRETAARLALFDVLASLAEVADENHYCRPELTAENQVIEIEDGRHPVIEQLTRNFVPNDTGLAAGREELWIITGPNMAGKSTFLRQNGLFVLMAQMGSFIPAARARLGLFDHIFTRIGASDNLSRGLSTFMVEMTETARILHQAGPRSLIILDEIGRGTSTFDGLSLAWAIAEEIADHRHSLTLFATHYHELTELELIKPTIRNYNVAIRQQGDSITFLHRINPGATNHSYGIEVARLAGLPEAVIDRARQILGNLEAAEIAAGGNLRLTGKTVPGSRTGGRESGYLPLLEPPPAPETARPKKEPAPKRDRLIELLQKTDLNRTTPIKALVILEKMKKLLTEEQG